MKLETGVFVRIKRFTKCFVALATLILMAAACSGDRRHKLAAGPYSISCQTSFTVAIPEPFTAAPSPGPLCTDAKVAWQNKSSSYAYLIEFDTPNSPFQTAAGTITVKPNATTGYYPVIKIASIRICKYTITQVTDPGGTPVQSFDPHVIVLGTNYPLEDQ
jgi:hypothetical protein